MTSDLRLAEPRPWAAPGLLADVERARFRWNLWSSPAIGLELGPFEITWGHP